MCRRKGETVSTPLDKDGRSSDLYDNTRQGMAASTRHLASFFTQLSLSNSRSKVISTPSSSLLFRSVPLSGNYRSSREYLIFSLFSIQVRRVLYSWRSSWSEVLLQTLLYSCVKNRHDNVVRLRSKILLYIIHCEYFYSCMTNDSHDIERDIIIVNNFFVIADHVCTTLSSTNYLP